MSKSEIWILGQEIGTRSKIGYDIRNQRHKKPFPDTSFDKFSFQNLKLVESSTPLHKRGNCFRRKKRSLQNSDLALSYFDPTVKTEDKMGANFIQQPV